MRLSNRNSNCLTAMCLTFSLNVCSATFADIRDSTKPEATDQLEPIESSTKETEVDLVELAKSLTNEDIRWTLSPLGDYPVFPVLSKRASQFDDNQHWSSRQNWELRYTWMAGLEDPERDEICHYLLTTAYDKNWTIEEKYFALFEWSEIGSLTWNARILFRTENMKPTIEAERQMLLAAWKRRINDWEEDRYLKDRDGPAIQAAIEEFLKINLTSRITLQALEHAHNLDAIRDRRKDLNLTPFKAIMPSLAPGDKPEGYRILQAAYLAGNMKEQLRKDLGEECPLAGVELMLSVYQDLEYYLLTETSDVLDHWLFTDQEKLKRAVDLMVIHAHFPPPPPKPLLEDE